MASEELTRKKLVISGATGFIGRYLLNYLFTNPECFSYRPVVIVTRSSPENTKASLRANPIIAQEVHQALEDPSHGLQVIQWDTRTIDSSENGWASHVDGCHAVIHLAGEGIFERRWSEEFKKELMDSRVRTTRLFSEAIGRSSSKPRLFISASAVGIYGDTGDKATDETSSLEEKGKDFLADVCHNWEEEAFRAKELSGGQTRVFIPRIGLVLQADGGALKNMILPFWLHIGGHVGSGLQWFAWIHMLDSVRAILFPLSILSSASSPSSSSSSSDSLLPLEGAYNVVAPNVVRLRDFCIELGVVMNRWSWAHVPWLAARILLGEVANTVVTGQRLAPKRLLEAGFQFKFAELTPALRDIIEHPPTAAHSSSPTATFEQGVADS